jgi:hypothetical protein
VGTIAESTIPSKQSWFADNSSAGGKIMGIKVSKMVGPLLEHGPKYRYFPKPSKTVLIVKDSVAIDIVRDIGTGIKYESE